MIQMLVRKVTNFAFYPTLTIVVLDKKKDKNYNLYNILYENLYNIG